MKVYSYSQARQNFASVLDEASKEEVLVKRKGGQVFCITIKQQTSSPFEVPTVKTQATTKDILKAIKESRSS